MQCQETQRFRGRTSADIVCGVLDLLSQSKRSAALKAHCCHAHAQHASAAHRRWHPLSEKMRDAALPCPSGADGILSEGCELKDALFRKSDRERIGFLE